MRQLLLKYHGGYSESLLTFWAPEQDGKGGIGEEGQGLRQKKPSESYLNREGTASLLSVKRDKVHPPDSIFLI